MSVATAGSELSVGRAHLPIGGRGSCLEGAQSGLYQYQSETTGLESLFAVMGDIASCRIVMNVRAGTDCKKGSIPGHQNDTRM